MTGGAGTTAMAAWFTRAASVSFDRARALSGLRFIKIGTSDHAAPCPRQPGSRNTLNVSAKKHKWLCRRCCEGGSSAIDFLLHVGAAADAKEAAQRLLGETPPARVGSAGLDRDMAAKRAGFEAGYSGDNPHALLEAFSYPHSLFMAGFTEGQDKKAREKKEQDNVKSRIARARAMLGAARHDAPAISAYFSARGITFFPPVWMRLARRLAYWHEGKIIHEGPAILTPMVGEGGQITACHATWIDRAAPPKFRPVLKDKDGRALPTKKMFGVAAGTLMRLDPPAPFVLLGEGLETVAAARAALSRTVCGVAAGSLNALEHVPLAAFRAAREVVILGDGDSNAQATRAVLVRAGERLKTAGIAKVRLAMAPAGKDFAQMVGA